MKHPRWLPPKRRYRAEELWCPDFLHLKIQILLNAIVFPNSQPEGTGWFENQFHMTGAGYLVHGIGYMHRIRNFCSAWPNGYRAHIRFFAFGMVPGRMGAGLLELIGKGSVIECKRLQKFQILVEISTVNRLRFRRLTTVMQSFGNRPGFISPLDGI